MIDTRHLAHLLALDRHRHFGRAAEEMFLTQSALSRSIQALERQLGVPLFDRGRDGVEPTPIGNLVIERARGIATDLQDLSREIELMKGLEVGTLHLALAPYTSVLAGLVGVARLLAAHPHVNYRVRVMNYRQVTGEVVRGDCDVGFAELSVAANNPALTTEVVVARPASFFCRCDHPLAEQTHVTPEDLIAYPWVATRLPSRLRDFLPDILDRAGSWDDRTGELVPSIEIELLHGSNELAVQSDALLVATATIVESDLMAKRLRRVSFQAPWFRFRHGFITRRNRTLSPIAEEFMRLVRSIEAELDERENDLLAGLD
jgi:DNA-binding transcriptional LysR family regulator